MRVYDRYLRYLFAHDYGIIETESAKFTTLKSNNSEQYYFLTKNGIIRYSKTPHSIDGFNVRLQMWSLLYQWEQLP